MHRSRPTPEHVGALSDERATPDQEHPVYRGTFSEPMVHLQPND